MMWLLLLQLWTSIPHDASTLLQGHWQSCRESDGYGERIYEHRVNGKFQWELHMGPYDEFAVYDHQMPDDHRHTGPDNLLTAYKAQSLPTKLHSRNWYVEKLNLTLNVTQGGGSRDDCEAYYVKVDRKYK